MERNLLSGLRTIALGAVVLGVSSVAAQGAVLNPSFETPPLADGGFVNLSSFSGTYSWQESGASTSFIYNPVASEMPSSEFDGENLVLLDADNGYTVVYQTLSDTVDTNQTYELKFLVGRGNGFTLNDYKVSLWDGDSEVASIDNGVGGSGPSPAAGTMDEVTLAYTPQIGDSGAFTIYIEPLGTAFNGLIYVDNIRLNVIPEPSAAALLGLGMVGLAARRRQRA